VACLSYLRREGVQPPGAWALASSLLPARSRTAPTPRPSLGECLAERKRGTGRGGETRGEKQGSGKA